METLKGSVVSRLNKITMVIGAIAVLFLSTLSSVVVAGQVDGLNQMHLAVKDQSQRSLQLAFSQALGQVLVKLSGNNDVKTLPIVRSSFRQAKNYVTQYSYYKEKQGDESRLMLNVAFDQAALKQLLEQANQPVWSADRPTILIWIDDGSSLGHGVISTSRIDGTFQALKKAAEQRGVNIIFPMMDLQDQHALPAVAGALLSDTQLATIAERYGADAVLTGYAMKWQNNQWQGRWQLMSKQQPFIWQDMQPTENQLMNMVMNKAIDVIVNQYAMLTNLQDKNTVSLEIDNVADLVAYTKVLQLLKQQDRVDDVNVGNMNGASLFLEVSIHGTRNDFITALNKNKQLFSIDTCSQQAQDDMTLCYSWGKPIAVAQDEVQLSGAMLDDSGINDLDDLNDMPTSHDLDSSRYDDFSDSTDSIDSNNDLAQATPDDASSDATTHRSPFSIFGGS